MAKDDLREARVFTQVWITGTCLGCKKEATGELSIQSDAGKDGLALLIGINTPDEMHPIARISAKTITDILRIN